VTPGARQCDDARRIVWMASLRARVTGRGANIAGDGGAHTPIEKRAKIC